MSSKSAEHRRMGRYVRGFTLLETLLATVLFVTGFLALSGALSTSLSAAGNNENLVVAVALAQEKVEEIRNTAYASVAGEAKAAVSGFPIYQRDVVVTTPQANLKQVIVTVYWNNKSNELSTALTTYVANP